MGPETDDLEGGALPLLPVNGGKRALVDPWYLIGDHLKSLLSLRLSVGRSAKLVYFESPRLETDLSAFAAADARERLSVWLSLNQTTIMRLLALSRDDGVIVILCGIAEQPYLQVMLDEIIGPENRVGTIAWQKGYSVQGQKKDKPKKDIYPTHDNLMIYSRRKSECLETAALKSPPKNFSNLDADPRGLWKAEQKGANYSRPSSDFSVNIPPYRWDLISGNPPPWFWCISPKSGVIWADGADVKQAGKWTFRVRVTDREGVSCEKDLTLSVADSGTPPAPASPGWLIARDKVGNFSHGELSANAPREGGALQITTEHLPIGVVGYPYFACVTAEGGAPYIGTTRPGKNSNSGKSRFWDVSFETLLRASAEDAIDFKSKDDSIPAIKVHLGHADFTYVNQISTWRGDGRGKMKGGMADPLRVGWGQDAKKELELLHATGAVGGVINVSKPAGLMSRLVAMFTAQDDLVVDVGSPASEMASVACQLGRRVVYVDVPGSPFDRDEIRVPRLQLAAQGKHPVPDGVYFSADIGDPPGEGYLVGRRPRDVCEDAGVCLFVLGEQFLEVDKATSALTVNYVDYAPGSSRFQQALAAVEGLVWSPGNLGEFARSPDGKLIAIHLPGTIALDGRVVQELQEQFQPWLQGAMTRIRIYFHRGRDDVDRDSRVELRHVPFALVSAAGANA